MGSGVDSTPDSKGMRLEGAVTSFKLYHESTSRLLNVMFNKSFMLNEKLERRTGWNVVKRRVWNAVKKRVVVCYGVER